MSWLIGRFSKAFVGGTNDGLHRLGAIRIKVWVGP